MNALELHDIDVTLGTTPVLDRVSLKVASREFVAILGPSGAGKSTLFRLLTGALLADRGAITVDSQPLNPTAHPFAFMPQRDALLPWLRILDNITLGLEVQGMPRALARDKVTPLLPTFGLEGCAMHYPSQLSGGMRQRAALLRTVVQDKPVQLLDEPFGALDALTRLTMQRWLKARWSEARWTTLLITHDVREAVALADRIYVLSRTPAHVIFEVATAGRGAAALEAEILDILLTQTGDDL